MRVAQNDLAAAKHGASHSADHLNRMSHFCQPCNRLWGNPFLQRDLWVNSIGCKAETRPVQRGLRVKLIILQPDDHLQMPLRLHKTAHHAERTV